MDKYLNILSFNRKLNRLPNKNKTWYESIDLKNYSILASKIYYLPIKANNPRNWIYLNDTISSKNIQFVRILTWVFSVDKRSQKKGKKKRTWIIVKKTDIRRRPSLFLICIMRKLFKSNLRLSTIPWETLFPGLLENGQPSTRHFSLPSALVNPGDLYLHLKS